jgi:hypothetical protein
MSTLLTRIGSEKMRKVILGMIGLTAVIVAVFCSYSSAFGKPVAHHIPVAVAASPPVLAKLETSPALRVYQVRDLAVARSMVEDRAVYGGLVLTRTGQATLVVANGGGHAVEAVLVQLGQQAAGAALNTRACTSASGPVLRTLISKVDVAPTSPGDPNGLVEFYCVVFLGIGAAAGAMLLARILGPVSHLRGALKRLGLMTVHTALLSAAITVVTDIVYGAMAGHFWFLFLTLWLYVIAVCLAITGFAAFAGPLASIVLIGLFIAFGNTSSGGAVPRPLLDGFFSALNPVLPQGAALSALRGVQYFGDRGIGIGLLCLTIWAAAGLALLGVASLRASRHRPAVTGAAAMARI